MECKIMKSRRGISTFFVIISPRKRAWTLFRKKIKDA